MSQESPIFVQKPHTLVDKFVLFTLEIVARIWFALLVFVNFVTLVYALWAVWVFSAKLRELVDNSLLSIAVYVASFASIAALGVVIQKYWFPLIYGKPAFGELGGIPVRMLLTSMKIRAQIDVELSDYDQVIARKFNTVQVRLLHDTLKENYEKIKQKQGIKDEGSDKEWAEIWDSQILNMTFNGQSFREAADVNRFGYNYAMSAVLRSSHLVPLLSSMFWIVVVVLLYLNANHRLELLTVIQVGLTLAFLLTAFWQLFVMHHLSIVPLSLKGIPLPNSTKNELSEEIKSIEGTEIRPNKIHIKPRFYEILRNYQFSVLLCNFVPPVIIWPLLIGAMYAIIHLIDGDFAESVRSYHIELAGGILIAGIGLPLSFYIFAVVIQNFRTIAAALIAAVLSASLPFLIDYVLGGGGNISGVREALFAGGGGLR